ncbi:hypothetical protein J6590_043240 [Homalodisca vitripennis]|nr:hypothetical protein J6590_101686 [Homalodisca vitripennis]KAG8316704.1 hypothetical protein J6590_043240 [Homalodisca vitripennis]
MMGIIILIISKGYDLDHLLNHYLSKTIFQETLYSLCVLYYLRQDDHQKFQGLHHPMKREMRLGPSKPSCSDSQIVVVSPDEVKANSSAEQKSEVFVTACVISRPIAFSPLVHYIGHIDKISGRLEPYKDFSENSETP